MSVAAQEARISHKRNHSVRKSCVKALRKAGVSNHKTIQVTGHKCKSTLSLYDRELSDEEQDGHQMGQLTRQLIKR